MEAVVNKKAMFPRKVVLKDESEFDGSALLIRDNEELVVTLENTTMPVVFLAFNDSERTAIIKTSVQNLLIMNAPAEVREYVGYTRMTGINASGSNVTIHMRKPIQE